MENAFNFATKPAPITNEDLAVAQTQRDTPTFGESFRAAVEYDGTIPALIRQYHGAQFEPQEGYAASEEEWGELTKDLPSEDHYKFIQAQSPAHAQFIREHLLEEKRNAAVAGENPWASVAAGLTDPGMIAVGAVAAPFAVSSRSTMLLNAIRSGAVTGTTNVASMATLRALQDREYSLKDSASDFFFGAAIGMPLGALASPAEQAMARAAGAGNGRQLVKERAEELGLHVSEDTAAPVPEQNVAPRFRSTGAPTDVADNEYVARVDNGSGGEAGINVSDMNDGTMRVTWADNGIWGGEAKSTGKGLVTGLYKEAIALARSKGKKLTSDTSVSESAARVWDRLSKAGYGVVKNPAATLDSTYTSDMRWVTSDGSPVFYIESVPEDPAMGSVGAMATDMDQVAQPINPDYRADFDVEATPKSALTHMKLKLPYFGEVKVPLRFDMRSRLGASDNPWARKLGEVLGGESVGLQGKGVNKASAAEWAMFHQMQLGTKVGRSWRESYAAWVRENKFTHKEALSGERADAFDLEVGKALRGDTTVTLHAQKTAQAISQAQADILALAKKHGVEGFEEIAANPEYAMRMFNHRRIEELNELYGTGNLQKLIKGSLQKVRPDWDDVKLAKVAKQYLRAVRIVGRDKKLPKAGAYAQKDRDYLMEKLKDNGFDSETADDILELLSNGKSEGGTPRSKARLPLDENHKEFLKNNLTGELEEVGITDLFEQNGTVLFNTYLRQMSGQIALAQAGIKSEAQFKQMMTQMLDDGRGDTQKLARYAQALYDHVVGRPIYTDDFGRLTDAARVLGGLNYLRMGNQFGFAQIAELGHMMSPTYIRSFINGIPAFKDLLQMAKGGQFTSKMARDIEEAIGFGGEFHLHRPTLRSEENIADGVHHSKTVHQLDRLSRVTSTISGLRSVNNMERGVTANVVIQRLSNWAIKNDLSKKDIDELAFLGLEGKDTQALFTDIKKYLEYRESELVPNAKVKGINYEKWQAESPDTYDKFRMTVFRETNRIILDPDVGKTPLILHHPVMKPLFQFRRFMLAAYSSHLLHGMHSMNLDTAAAFAGSMFLGGMAYIAQQGVNYAHDTDKLAERLAPEEIAKAAFNRAAFSSLIPMATDSALGMLGYDPQFAYTRNSTLPSGMLIGNPSVDFANKLWNTAGTVTGSLVGNRTPTERDVQSAYSLLPFSNALGVRTLGHMLSKQFPKNDPNETYEPQ